jgi:hypothetical protein
VNTHHKQVTVTVREWSAEVDEKLAPLIEELWQAGLGTLQSCQHHSVTGKAWISFPTANDAESFLNMVVGGGKQTGWARAEMQYFGQYEATAKPLGKYDEESRHHPAEWEFHAFVWDEAFGNGGEPNFWIGIAVLFPRRDLKRVLERVRTWNARQTAEAA